MNILLAPVAAAPAERVSRNTFRKQILPVGEITYKGRKIKFDKEYLQRLAENFHGQAYDQVSTMLADEKNAHTMDPRQFGGEVVDVEVTDKGLYGVFKLSKDAARVVKDSGGKIGVSARIVEGLERADGKTFDKALQHVLITTDPRITGMDAWTECELSGYNDGDEIVDLTSSSYEGEGDMPKTLDVKTASLEDLNKLTEDELLALSDEEFAALEARLADVLGDDDDADDEDDDLRNHNTDADDDSRQLAGAALSNPYFRSLDLANEQRDIELASIKQQLADTRFEAEAKDWVKKGVPPALVELARPLLTLPDEAVLDLSNGVDDQTVNVAELARELLKQTAGYIELAKERGHSFSPTPAEEKSQEVKDILDAWKIED